MNSYGKLLFIIGKMFREEEVIAALLRRAAIKSDIMCYFNTEIIFVFILTLILFHVLI